MTTQVVRQFLREHKQEVKPYEYLLVSCCMHAYVNRRTRDIQQFINNIRAILPPTEFSAKVVELLSDGPEENRAKSNEGDVGSCECGVWH